MVQILHVTTAHGRDDARIYHKECVSLWSAGYDVTLLAPGLSCPDNSTSPSVVGLGRFSSRLGRMILGPSRVLYSISKIRPDVVHIHDPELLLLVPLFRLLGSRVVYDAHEDYPRQIVAKQYIPKAIRSAVARIFECFENLVTRLCVLIVAATPTIAERFNKLGRPTICVRNFALSREFQVSNGHRDGTDLVYVGGITRHRGLQEMISLAERLNATLHLAGPLTPSSLINELSSAEAQRHVQYHGVLERAEVSQLLSQAGVGLLLLHPLPNHTASLPVKLFEYLAAGLPVIASDFPYWRALMAGSDVVTFVAWNDAEAIAEATSAVLRRLEQRGADVRAAARQVFTERFSWDSEAQQLLASYGKFIAPVRAPLPEPTR